MPHIRIRGMKPLQVAELSIHVANELAAIIKTPPENFTIEHIPSQFFTGGIADEGYPMIDIFWFERPLEVKELTANHLTKRVKEILPDADVSLIFHNLEKSNYFENGRHF